MSEILSAVSLIFLPLPQVRTIGTTRSYGYGMIRIEKIWGKCQKTPLSATL
jgi:hypothetical protein